MIYSVPFLENYYRVAGIWHDPEPDVGVFSSSFEVTNIYYDVVDEGMGYENEYEVEYNDSLTDLERDYIEAYVELNFGVPE